MGCGAPGRLQQPFLGEVSLKDAVQCDLASFLTALLFVFVLSCVILTVVAVTFFEVPAPRESPGEIFLGLVLVLAVVLAVIRVRAASITSTLKNGEIVDAKLLNSVVYQLFVYLVMECPAPGGVARKRLSLPNTRRPRTVASQEHVVLSIRGGRAVVRDLFM